MKVLKYSFFLMIIFLNHLYSQELRVEIDKEEYYFQEDIYIYVTLENTTDEPKTFYHFLYLMDGIGIDVLLWDNNETKVEKSQYSFVHYSEAPSITLKPGESKLEIVDLFESYGQRGSYFPRGVRYALEVGQYTMQIVYTNPDETRRRTNPIYSDKIQFNVVEPPEAEKEVLEVLRASFPPRRELDKEEERTALKQILKTYPNSVYAPRMYERLASLHYPENMNEMKKYLLKLIETYPDNGLAVRTLHNQVLRRDMVSEQEREELINKLIETKSDTKVGRYLLNRQNR